MILNEDVQSSLTIFDIDDTLFHTISHVHVIRGGKRVASLTPAEFNVYTLRTDEHYDFADFTSAKHFMDTAKPIDTVFRTAKRMMQKLKSPNKRFIIVTARSDMDDKNLFINTFRKYGFDIDRSHIYRAGNINAPAPEAKKQIIRAEMIKSKYQVVRMFDDAQKNIDRFLELKSEFPNAKFEAFLIKENGRIVRIT